MPDVRVILRVPEYIITKPMLRRFLDDALRTERLYVRIPIVEIEEFIPIEQGKK